MNQVAKIVEISAESPTSFEDAMKKGVGRASESLKGISGAWVKEQKLVITDNKISGYRVNMQVTFVLDSKS